MKRIVYLSLIIVSVLTVSACASKCKKTDTTPAKTVESEFQNDNLKKDNNKKNLLINYSFLNENNVGETLSVTGSLHQNGNGFTLIADPDSKSRVTFILEVTDSELKKKLQSLAGKTVTVTGELLEANSTWTKKLKVQSVE